VVIARAVQHLDQPGLADDLAEALTSYFAHGHTFGNFRTEDAVEALKDAGHRRTLLEALMGPVREGRLNHRALILTTPELATPEDVPWMIEQLNATHHTNEQMIWAELLHQLTHQAGADTNAIWEAIWDARQENASLYDATLLLYGPIELGSDDARRFRESHAGQEQRAARKAAEEAGTTISNADVEALLDRFDAGEELFADITVALWPGKPAMPFITTGGDFTRAPGWEAADTNLRLRIAAAAETHLNRYTPPQDSQPAGILYGWQLAGYSALLYLHAYEPDRFEQIDPEKLPLWIAALLAAANAGEREAELDARMSLMRHLKTRAPEQFVTAVIERVTAEAGNGEGHLFVLHRVQFLIDDDLGGALFDVWKSESLSPQAYGDLLRALLQANVDGVLEHALSALTPGLIDSQPEIARRLATALLATEDTAVWAPFEHLWNAYPS
jgi:hypothetical protein